MLRLAKRLHGSHGHVHGAALLSKRARDVTLLGLGANLVLLLAKGSAGVYFRSASLVADAAHSLSDLVTDGITLAAIKVSKLPPNHEYPVNLCLLAGLMLSMAMARSKLPPRFRLEPS